MKTIAVIGPNAADVHLGGYSRDPGRGVSILQGIREYVGSRAKVAFAEGCKITLGKQGWDGWYEDKTQLADPATQSESIRVAVVTARKADVAVVVVGETESTNREAWSEQHLGDRDSLDLLGAQNELIRKIVETGVPIVVFLINGRPLSTNYVAEHAAVILEGWYLSPQRIKQGQSAVVRVDVTNAGSREGDEVAQLYIHQRVASITRPVKELRGFRCIHLRACEKQTVEFPLTPDALSLLDVNMKRVVEPGDFDLMVGANSAETTSVTLTVEPR